MIFRLFLLFMLLCSGAQAEELLPPEIAFKPSARALDGQTIELRFDIANGYYLYRDKFRFAASPVSVQLGTPVLPKGKEKLDETFGKVEAYYREARIRLPVERNSSGPLALTLQITAQGCADIGICYPPQRHSLALELPDPNTAPASQAESGDESGRIAHFLKHSELWLVATSFFGFGLLLALTPCIFPMIPILSGIIVGSGRDGHGVSHARGFALSLAYVLGMATTYAAAGVAAGYSGTLLSTALQNPWALGAFALTFVVLAFSMFGFFELQLPTMLQSKASEEASHFRSGSLPGVAIMGALSSLIIGPCVAAPLAGALLYIGQTGDSLLGGTALFCLGLGMGAPLLMVGASAGTLLPKSGPWMEAVKKAFGFILLGTALWIVSPFIPVALQMAGWALLLIIPAILLRAIDPLPTHSHNGQRFWKAIGVILLLSGIAMLVGAFSGATDPLQPLSGLRPESKSGENRQLSFERIRSLAELDARLKTEGRPVMLDFYADWCVSCKEMESSTLADPRVQHALSGWTLLQADVTGNSDDDKALLARFKLFGPPGMIFFNRHGEEIAGVRVIGFQNTSDFLATLARLHP